MSLVVYGDFNCPFSALASHRIDILHDRDIADVEFRAVEHSPRIPPDGLAVIDKRRADLTEEVEQVLGLVTAQDGKFRLRVPEVLPNTATMCQSYATTPTADLRKELFAAVWSDGVATGVLTADGTAKQAAWQAEYESWPEDKRIVPSLVLDDGYISRGLGALKRLAEMLA
jgi:hypothetical protein